MALSLSLYHYAIAFHHIYELSFIQTINSVFLNYKINNFVATTIKFFFVVVVSTTFHSFSLIFFHISWIFVL